MVRFPSNSSQISLKKWLVFLDKKGSQLWLDFLQIQSNNRWNNGWFSQIKGIATMVIFA